MKPTVTVYTQKNCNPCNATIKWLQRNEVYHEIVDLDENPDIRDELIAEGFMQTPIVKYGADSWTGFRPSKLMGVK